MCVLALAWRAHPRWRLVLAGNRDERHARPAEPLARWSEADHVLAGRDQVSGGTWLGVSEEGRFGVVTNIRGHGGPSPDAPSRGLLLKDLLFGKGRYADPPVEDFQAFSPFNLIRIRGAEAEFWSNQPTPVRAPLEPGLYGLSNGRLDEAWPKTTRLKTILADWLAAGTDRPEPLLDGLQEERLDGRPLAPTLPSEAPPEPWTTPIFIRHPVYGTRCGTVVTVDERGRGLMIERRFDADGAVIGETALRFTWPVSRR